jgi:hypothetical protein
MIEYIEKLPSAKDKEIEVLKNLFHNQNTDKEMKLELFEQISEKIQTSLVDDLCEKDDDFCKSFYRSHDSISNTFRRRFGFVAFGFNKEILDFNARETKIIDGFSKYIEILVDETGRTDDKMLYAAAETYKRFLVEFDTNFLEALLQRKMELQDNQAPSEFEIVIPQLLSPKMIVKLADDSCFQNKFN